MRDANSMESGPTERSDEAAAGPVATSDAIDRRRGPRIALEATVDFSSESNFYTGFTSDISEGGLFVATYALQTVGTRVELRFDLPDGYEIHVVGVVRWVRDPRDPGDQDVPPGIGIQFEQLTPDDEAAISAFVSVREALFYID